jgi:hypothetical protein
MEEAAMTRMPWTPAAALALSAALALPAAAQEAPAPAPEDDGFSLMEEGAKLILRGMMSEMEPALDEMGKALEEMQPMLDDLGPQLAELMKMIGDVRNYEAPVKLPNGDILIRRKPDAPLTPPPGPDGQIDL